MFSDRLGEPWVLAPLLVGAGTFLRWGMEVRERWMWKKTLSGRPWQSRFAANVDYVVSNGALDSIEDIWRDEDFVLRGSSIIVWNYVGGLCVSRNVLPVL